MKVFLFLALTLFSSCSAKSKSDSPALGGRAQEDSPGGITKESAKNGEGVPIPSPLGPLQKPKKSCKAPKLTWGGPDPSLPQIASLLPPGTHSLKAIRKTRVYREPNSTSLQVGMVKQYSRLPLTRYAPAGNGCKTWWLNTGEAQYICGSNLKPDKRPMLLRKQPIIPRRRITPHRYGRVRKEKTPYFRNVADLEANKSFATFFRGDMISLKKFKTAAGRRYWITGKNFLVWDADIMGYKVPRYHGIDLRKKGINLPAGIIRAKKYGATVYEYPGGPEKKSIKPLKHYSAWAIYDRKRVKLPGKHRKALFYRLKPGWVKARRMLSAWPNSPPKGLKPCEKWIEINVSMQTLVAYEGEEPVYMAPISSGNKRHPTKYGIFRTWLKKANSDMTSSLARERYRVDEVPWSVFFYLGQALHAAYWHTNFGNRKSHGCVNLTPIDARWLFEWIEPGVPDGWLELRVDEKSPIPGTTIVVRHKYEHEVPYMRYARHLAPKEEMHRLDEVKKKHLEKLTKRLLKNR